MLRLIFTTLLFFISSPLWASSEWVWSRGTNSLQEVELLPVVSGRGGVGIAAPFAPGAWQQSPASLTESNQTWLGYIHLSSFVDSYLDAISYSVPLVGKQNALGFQVVRFAQPDIPLVGEEEEIEGDGYRTFSVEEWWVQSQYGHAWGAWKLGVALNFYTIELDQTGYGWDADLQLLYEYGMIRWGVEASNAVGSYSVWDSGHKEYEEGELETSLWMTQKSPYFYGKFGLGWQSAGFLQEDSRSETSIDSLSNRVWEDPGGWLLSSKVGVEYLGDSGLQLRLGLKELRQWKNLTFGGSFAFDNWLQLDYSWEEHSELGVNHRFGIFFVPKMLFSYL